MHIATIKKQLKENKLKWYYRAYLVTLFHSIKQVQLGKAKSGPGVDGWGIRDTARELGMSVGSVHNYLTLSEIISKTPDVKSLTLKAALKKI